MSLSRNSRHWEKRKYKPSLKPRDVIRAILDAGYDQYGSDKWPEFRLRRPRGIAERELRAAGLMMLSDGDLVCLCGARWTPAPPTPECWRWNRGEFSGRRRKRSWGWWRCPNKDCTKKLDTSEDKRKRVGPTEIITVRKRRRPRKRA